MIKPITPDNVHFGRDPYSNDAILKFKMATLINWEFFVARHKFCYSTLLIVMALIIFLYYEINVNNIRKLIVIFMAYPI
jgi:hypothetical protein